MISNTVYDPDQAASVARMVIKMNEYCDNYTEEQLINHMIMIANQTYPEYSNEFGYIATMGFVVTVCKYDNTDRRYLKFSVDGWLIESYFGKRESA